MTGIVDLLRMCAYMDPAAARAGAADPHRGRPVREHRSSPRRRGRDGRGAHGALSRGRRSSAGSRRRAQSAVTRILPRLQRRDNLGDGARPARGGRPPAKRAPRSGSATRGGRLHLQDDRRPFTGRISCFRVLRTGLGHDARRPAHPRRAMGQVPSCKARFRPVGRSVSAISAPWRLRT